MSENGILYKLAERGHYNILRKYAQLLNAKEGWCLNKLHEEVLSDENKDLSDFRNVSVLKKANANNNSITPLHFAAINPNPRYIKELVESSGSFDATDDLRRTPLFFAAVCESSEPLKYLIRKGARLDVKGMLDREQMESEVSALQQAVRFNKPHNIPYLLGKHPGFEPTTVSPSPIHQSQQPQIQQPQSQSGVGVASSAQSQVC